MWFLLPCIEVGGFTAGLVRSPWLVYLSDCVCSVFIHITWCRLSGRSAMASAVVHRRQSTAVNDPRWIVPRLYRVLCRLSYYAAQ